MVGREHGGSVRDAMFPPLSTVRLKGLMNEPVQMKEWACPWVAGARGFNTNLPEVSTAPVMFRPEREALQMVDTRRLCPLPSPEGGAFRRPH